MKEIAITHISTKDVRFPLQPGAGTDSVHTNPIYSYAVTHLHTNRPLIGTGLVFTLGDGNDQICQLIETLAQPLVNRDIEEVMAGYGTIFKAIADHPRYRWLGPHKGMVHLALASITNACFDLWAKSRDLPLWPLLIDLSPEEVVQLLDLSYLEDVLTAEEALDMLLAGQSGRTHRNSILERGYPGYDTSIGWFNYPDEQVKENVRWAVDAGFTAMKLKVGSADMDRDIRRAYMVREAAGDETKVMLDANQSWSLPQAIKACLDLAGMEPYWIEEPTQPDDVFADQTLARAIAPMKIALGEHVSNRVLFKNFLQAGATSFVQVDCTRVGGVSEFITVSLLARKFGVPVVPHVGDMGQIHQHLVLFNHIVLGQEVVFLEYIPHLRQYFVHPATVADGVYKIPQEPGSSSDLLD